MKTAKPISTLYCGMLMIGMLFSACDNSKNEPTPIDNQHALQFIEEGNELHVATSDYNLILTFSKDDFADYHSELNLKNTLSIEKLHFICQKDEFFSNDVWIIKPENIIFDKDFIITIKYTHEEFAPEFNTTNLKIYKLKRDYQNQENKNNEHLLMRVSDLRLLDQCVQSEDQMYVYTKISGFGGFVLGRKVQ
jgi:hypothetical protein